MKELIKAGGDRFFYLIKKTGLFPSKGIRILMYHSTPAQPVSGEEIPLSVSEKSLRVQFETIKAQGYKVIRLQEACEILQKSSLPQERLLVLSFDDFYANNFSVAIPLLEQFGFKAVFFPAVAYLDKKEPFPWLKNPASYGPPGTKKMLKEIFSLGHEIGSHSYTHPTLTDLNEKNLTQELFQSKNELEDILGAPVKLFCYPYGHRKSFNARIQQKLKELGYICALTTLEGINQPFCNLFSLKRTAIIDQDDGEKFSQKLNGIRDWFYLRQLLQGIF